MIISRCAEFLSASGYASGATSALDMLQVKVNMCKLRHSAIPPNRTVCLETTRLTDELLTHDSWVCIDLCVIYYKSCIKCQIYSNVTNPVDNSSSSFLPLFTSFLDTVSVLHGLDGLQNDALVA